MLIIPFYNEKYNSGKIIGIKLLHKLFPDKKFASQIIFSLGGTTAPFDETLRVSEHPLQTGKGIPLFNPRI